jgi:hypothetical protein
MGASCLAWSSRLNIARRRIVQVHAMVTAEAQALEGPPLPQGGSGKIHSAIRQRRAARGTTYRRNAAKATIAQQGPSLAPENELRSHVGIPHLSRREEPRAGDIMGRRAQNTLPAVMR